MRQLLDNSLGTVQQADVSPDNNYSTSHTAHPQYLNAEGFLPGKYEEFLKRICKFPGGPGSVF